MKLNRGLYSTLLTLFSPYFLWKVSKETTEQNSFSERLGYTPNLPIKPVIWLHAASVGEVIAATPLIRKLQKEYESHLILVTTMTATGARQARKVLQGNGAHLLLPLDLPWVASRFLDRIKPEVVIFMETELWPNLIHGCHQREIPFVIANGRLSDKSLRSYRKLSKVTQEVLKDVSVIAAKSDKDAHGFVELGAPADKVVVTGSIKFDVVPEVGLQSKADFFREESFASRPVWVAGSTHPGEDERLLAAHKEVLEQLPDAVLILVPRHPQRFDAVAQLLDDQGWEYVRRTSNDEFGEEHSVYLADTMGELMLMYATSDVAFVAGSIKPVGGHNLLEPACLKKPVLSGGYLFNFNDVAEMFDQNNALSRCTEVNEISTKVIELLQDPEYRKEMGQKAYQVVEKNRGALERQFRLIEKSLQESKQAKDEQTAGEH
ncbi:MAG: 3-deoxy-D-manno-octulosonic acid transferase [Oceanospirillum sp.]|nr:3-deoxy-D-manno-octulosonic acid transferase [Oceanospirillum sp.]